MILYTFKKEEGKWYIDLPEWQESKSALQMVAGADVLLDELSNNQTSIQISISTIEKPLDYATLKKMINIPLTGGALYHLGLKPIWLCDVTKFVFGEFPQQIHFKVI